MELPFLPKVFLPIAQNALWFQCTEEKLRVVLEGLRFKDTAIPLSGESNSLHAE